MTYLNARDGWPEGMRVIVRRVLSDGRTPLAALVAADDSAPFFGTLHCE
ncbi:hypothetical protein ABT255_60280 [Streptomyces mirabilis]